jgi:hypothetical protein
MRADSRSEWREKGREMLARGRKPVSEFWVLPIHLDFDRSMVVKGRARHLISLRIENPEGRYANGSKTLSTHWD